MSEIETLDLKTFITNAVNEIFDRMLSTEVEVSVAESAVAIEGNRIVGSVGFAGKAMGNICVHVSDTFARIITATMLGMELDEIESEEEVHDALGEFSNMIGGDLKSRLSDSGLPCELSIPSITSGSDFEIETMGWSRHEMFTFRHGEHIGLVEVFIKPGE